MKNNKDCPAIRELIEENVLRKNVEEHSGIREHIESCSECGKYLSDLVMLRAASGYSYALPDIEKGRFSALVRTRIEQRKNRNRKPAFAVRPAFQIALIMLIIFSVVFYLFRTEPEHMFVLDQSDLELIDMYGPGYSAYMVYDEEVITLLFARTIFGEDISMQEYWYDYYHGDDYYYDTYGLTNEEIDYIIQRLEEV